MGQQLSAFQKTLGELERNDPDLTALDLTRFALTDRNVRSLCDSMRNNK